MRHSLRHVTASSIRLQPENVWQLDPVDARILASIRVAAGPLVHVAIRIAYMANRSRPRGEFAIMRVDGSTWAVEHGTFDEGMPAPHPLLPPMGLLLTHAPASESETLDWLLRT